MRELTQEQLQTMTAEQITEFCRVQAKEEVRQRKLEREQAAQFEKVALPFVEAGQDFDSFMRQTQAPSSFRSRYERLQTQYQKAHTPSPEEVELRKLESEVQAAMGISSDDPQQQTEPTGYSGRNFFSAWAQYSQSQQDKQRRRCGGIGGTASESPEPEPEPDDPEEPDDDPDSSPEDDPDSEPEQHEQPESPEDDPTSPKHGEPSDNA